MNSQATVPAVRRSVTVNAPVEKAFAVFTESFATWWPHGHHINPNGYLAAYIEPRIGGRWYERAPDGSECEWGAVLAWEPPSRVLLSWHLNGEWEYDPDPEHASEVEVTFTPEDQGTRVTVVHARFERAAMAARLAEGVGAPTGWNGLLARFADAAEGRTPRPLP